MRREVPRKTPLFLSVPASVLVCALAHAQPPPNTTLGSEGEVIVTPPPERDGPAPDAPVPLPMPPPAAVADAVAPAGDGWLSPEKQPREGYLPGTGFVMQSEDAAFRLRVGLQAAYKFEPVYQNGDWLDRNMFFVLRPILSGNFFKNWIHFWTSMELAANPPYVLDSYIELFPWKELGLRIGQQFTPYDRHEYFGPQEILFPEWAPVSEYFWTGRDKGITAMGTLANQLEYWFGWYSGTPLRQYNALPGNYVLEGRLTWSPLGPVGATEFPYIISADGPAPFRVSGTIQGYYGKVQTATENFNPSTFRLETMATGEVHRQGALGGDFWLQGRWFVFYVDGTIRKTTPPAGAAYTSVGVWTQLGVPLIERNLDIAARFNWLNPSIDLSNDQFYSIEGQLAYYPMHTANFVMKLRYGLGHQDSPGMAALGAVPLVVTAGRTQLGTLQINLCF